MKSITSASALALAVLVAGCEDRGIREQKVAKGIEKVEPAASSTTTPSTTQAPPAPSSPSATPAASPSAPAAPSAATAAPSGDWKLPEGWSVVPGERPMRLATFSVADADGPIEVALTRFPGTVGGELANVNRWRGQMGQSPVDDAGLEALLSRFEGEGYKGYETRIDGANGQMLAVAVYESAADRTWFLRCTAPAAAIGRIRESVREFALTLPGKAGVGG